MVIGDKKTLRLNDVTRVLYLKGLFQFAGNTGFTLNVSNNYLKEQ